MSRKCAACPNTSFLDPIIYKCAICADPKPMCWDCWSLHRKRNVHRGMTKRSGAWQRKERR